MEDRRSLAVAFLLAMVALLVAAGLEVGAVSAQGGGTPRPTPTPDAGPVEGPTASDALPDLVVSAISVTPNPVLVNGPVTITVLIRNIGPGPVQPTNNFFVDLYVNPSVPPRACVPGDYYWPVQGYQMADNMEMLSVTIDPRTDPIGAAFRTTGIVQIWAQVDNATNAAGNQCGVVIETREDNNIRATTVDVDTRYEWKQTTAADFQAGYSSALDLTHPQGVLQNGTGWFFEPRFPRPEETRFAWEIQDPAAPWDSPHFYNPDRHILADNFPDNFPPGQINLWNPPDQENVDIKIVRTAATDPDGLPVDYVFAVWEDARNGDQDDRDIYFRFSDDSGRSWYAPVRVNQDPISNQKNQLKPKLVLVDVEDATTSARRPLLFVFWEDHRLNDADIFFARSFDYGLTWEEPAFANPVNDKNINPSADQRNVTADAVYVNVDTTTPAGAASCPDPDPAYTALGVRGCVYLYAAWEDYRNGNADIYAEWSRNAGKTWLRSDDGNPSTVDANIFVQPDPSSNAGVFDQGRPNLTVRAREVNAPFNNCIAGVARQIYYDANGNEIYRTRRYLPYNPLPTIYLAWEDERESLAGIGSQIYYTRGEFNYDANDEYPAGYAEPENCARPPLQSKPFLPAYRFEDDHVKADTSPAGSYNQQQNPVIQFNPDGFRSFAYTQSYTFGATTYSYTCEVRWGTEELLLSWQDDRDGTFDIWSNNMVDLYTDAQVAIVLDGAPPVFQVPLYDDPSWLDPAMASLYRQRQTRGCLGVGQALPVDGVLVGGEGENEAPITERPTVVRNASQNSPQPPRFLELGFPAQSLKISSGATFKEKPQCLVPGEPGAAPTEPSQQTLPDMALLSTDPLLQGAPKMAPTDRLESGLVWNVWVDTRSLDAVNQDLFLRPVVHYDTEDSLSVTQPNGEPIYLQTVQDNVKNQLALRRRDIFPDLQPPNVQQDRPSIDFYDRDGVFQRYGDDYALYVAWQDNRNANPYMGFEGNKDVFAARLQIDAPLYNNDYGLRPLRSGSFLSSVFGTGEEPFTWYDIEWWGDISADGSLTLQTRLGFDAQLPQPPQEDVTTYSPNGQVAWTRWTGVGGVGGFYNAPGQLITAPNGEQQPMSYYIQYRVNFNRQGKEGIHCISEVALNYERQDRLLYLPLVMK